LFWDGLGVANRQTQTGLEMIPRPRDKCELDSKLELKLHGALERYDLEHLTHPDIQGFEGKADFRCGDVWIEVWGRDEPGYEERRKAKLRFYHGAGYKLVEVFPEDLESLRRIDAIITQIQDRQGRRQARISTPPRTRRSVSLIAFQEAENTAELRELNAKVTSLREQKQAKMAELSDLERKLRDFATEIDSRKRDVKAQIRLLDGELRSALTVYSEAHRRSLLGKRD
jgi:hypothetical protein